MVTTREKAKELSPDPATEIQVVSYGYARAKKGFMAMAVVPAAHMALEKAGISIDDVKVIKTHNPFAANDIYLAKQIGIDVNGFNNYGSSLVFGHPQAPTAGRLIIEGIEETVLQGRRIRALCRVRRGRHRRRLAGQSDRCSNETIPISSEEVDEALESVRSSNAPFSPAQNLFTFGAAVLARTEVPPDGGLLPTKLLTSSVRTVCLCGRLPCPADAAEPIVIGVPTSLGFLEGTESHKAVEMAVERDQRQRRRQSGKRKTPAQGGSP